MTSIKQMIALVFTTLSALALGAIKFVWKTANNSVFDAGGFKHVGKS